VTCTPDRDPGLEFCTRVAGGRNECQEPRAIRLMLPACDGPSIVCPLTENVPCHCPLPLRTSFSVVKFCNLHVRGRIY
jgi:hypothetical protein